MKKKDFVTLILSTVGGILFALGTCMALLPEWEAMNQGIVIKFSGNQKYTSDAVSGAVFRNICAANGVPVQAFYNHSDQPGGSTLGNLSGRHVSIATVDIGMAQLAMHSSWETAGAKDLDWMVRGMTAFYQTKLCCLGDCDWQIG